MLSSEPAACRTTVIEGMPGAGKTTLLTRLERRGHVVLGEYTTSGRDVLAHRHHPHHLDEDAHLANWLRKAAQMKETTGPVWVDRDWLTALAFAASAGDLRERAAWAYAHLTAESLALPRCWIVLDLPPALSVRRRSSRLEAGHPWTDPAVLARLRDFYRDPATSLDTVHPQLAALVAAIPLHTVDATAEPGELARAVESAGSL